MDPRDVRRLAALTATSLAAIRCAIGIGALIRPSLAAAPWIGGAESRRSSVEVFGRALAGRDLALGSTFGALVTGPVAAKLLVHDDHLGRPARYSSPILA